MKEKFKSFIRKMQESQEKINELRNKNLKRVALLWSLVAALYGLHYFDIATTTAYIAQTVLFAISLPSAFIGFGIFILGFWVTTKVDAVVSVASRGSLVAEMALGEVKDRVIDSAIEASQSKPVKEG